MARCLIYRGDLLREQDPAAAETALATGQQAAPETAMLLAAGLTLEDIEALHHAAAGKTNAQIAKIMYLSVPTIERRFTHMYRRLGICNRAQAVQLMGRISAHIPDSAAGSEAPRTGASPNEKPDTAPGTAMLLAAGLTSEDIEALHHAAAGKTNAQIAKIMYLSVPTIERRFTRMYRRLGVRNRAQAVNLVSQYLVR